MNLNSTQIAAIVRNIVVLLGGYLVQHGLATAGQAANIEQVLPGAIMAIGGVVWSLIEKREESILAKADAIQEARASAPIVPPGSTGLHCHPAVAFAALALAVIGVSGCATTPTGTPSVAQQILIPSNIASATQDAVQIAAQLFLTRNPSYAGEVKAAADAFAALAAANPSAITGGDITAVLAKTSISTATKDEIGLAATLALGVYEKDFKVNLPGLAPQYAAFATAISAGLNAALPTPAPVSS